MSKGNSVGSNTNREGRHMKDDNSLRKLSYTFLYSKPHLEHKKRCVSFSVRKGRKSLSHTISVLLNKVKVI